MLKPMPSSCLGEEDSEKNPEAGLGRPKPTWSLGSSGRETGDLTGEMEKKRKVRSLPPPTGSELCLSGAWRS